MPTGASLVILIPICGVKGKGGIRLVSSNTCSHGSTLSAGQVFVLDATKPLGRKATPAAGQLETEGGALL